MQLRAATSRSLQSVAAGHRNEPKRHCDSFRRLHSEPGPAALHAAAVVQQMHHWLALARVRSEGLLSAADHRLSPHVMTENAVAHGHSLALPLPSPAVHMLHIRRILRTLLLRRFRATVKCSIYGSCYAKVLKQDRGIVWTLVCQSGALQHVQAPSTSTGLCAWPVLQHQGLCRHANS